MRLPADFDFGTAEVVEGKRVRPKPVRTALADLLPYPLVVSIHGLETKSEPNERCHWAVRHRRFRKQAEAVLAALWEHRTRLSAIGREIADHNARVEVTFTRHGKGTLDDDNIRPAFKGIRDELARLLEVDDGHAGIKWEYAQRRGEPAVTISIRSLT